jgi:HTH-type transcriptional regulator/antitoxin HipB
MMINTDDVARGIGQRISTRRKTLGITQEDLAELAGVSVRFLSSLEHGKASVRLSAVLAVLDALGLELTTQIRTQP